MQYKTCVMKTAYNVVYPAQLIGEKPARQSFNSLSEACAVALEKSKRTERLVHVLYQQPNSNETLVMICRRGYVIKRYDTIEY